MKETPTSLLQVKKQWTPARQMTEMSNLDNIDAQYLRFHWNACGINSDTAFRGGPLAPCKS